MAELGLIVGGGVTVEFPGMVPDGTLVDDALGGGELDDMMGLVAEAVADAEALEDEMLVVVVAVVNGATVVEITVDLVLDLVLVVVVEFPKRTGVVLVAALQ